MTAQSAFLEEAGKPWLLLLLVAGLLVAAAACGQDEPPVQEAAAVPPAASAVNAAAGDTIQVTGTLIDAHCYATAREHMSDAYVGPGGQTPPCEADYVQQGFPVAVLVDGRTSGPVWILATVPQALADYVMQTVKVTGEVRSAGVLIPHRVELRQGDAWTFVM